MFVIRHLSLRKFGIELSRLYEGGAGRVLQVNCFFVRPMSASRTASR
jgi:hypothetical protein